MAPPSSMAKPNDKDTSVELVEYLNTRKTTDVDTIEKADTSSSSHSHDEDSHRSKPPTTAKDLVTEILLVEDDPSLNPWTFRTWFIGIGLSVFAS
jgi:hypothetical protein